MQKISPSRLLLSPAIAALFAGEAAQGMAVIAPQFNSIPRGKSGNYKLHKRPKDKQARRKQPR